jgi:hypothetical protein
MRVVPTFQGLLSLWLALSAASCSSQKSASPNDADAGDAAPPEAPADGSLPPHSKTLPFAYTRPEHGTPIAQADIDARTDELLDLLTKTRYFGFVSERVHGWPESDPEKRFWYGTWWSGVSVQVQGGKVTYFHAPGGSDNDGISTSPLLEGACFAHLLWSDARLEHLERKIVRGFSSWILAMQRQKDDPNTLLTRASYPQPIASSDGNVAFDIDYSVNRPGIDNGATEYVHIAANPWWGDIWVKNKRSKDDIGHMFRAIAQIDACDGTFTEAGAQADLVQLRMLYQRWSRRVEDDNWGIMSLDKNAALWMPDDELAHFVSFGTIPIECAGQLALRQFGRVTPGSLDCGNGISALDATTAAIGHSNGTILRTFHEAAVSHALLAGNTALAQTLLGGLAQRLDDMMDGFEAGKPLPYLSVRDASDLILFSANAGVPLTWREVAYLHTQIQTAHTMYTATTNDLVYKTFAAGTPDGKYAFEPNGDGLDFPSIGALLGQCVAQWRNPASKPVLNCDRVRSWVPVF